jgi:hypothetical protein
MLGVLAAVGQHLPNLRDGLPESDRANAGPIVNREFRGLRLSAEARAAVIGLLVAMMFLLFVLIRLDPSGASGGPTLNAVSATTLKQFWVVEKGQTYGLIAERTGVSVPELEDLNPYTDPGSLDVGQRIRLRPAKGH